MANVRNVNDFVEQLSNCIGEISGDEVVFKKIPYTSEYVVRMRNHNEKVANIWYEYDKDKIIVQLVPAFRNMEYSLDDLTIDTIKGIGQMVRKNALNRIGESMGIDEAQQILNENGYYLLEASTYVDFPFMRILWERILREEEENENKFETHSSNPSKWIDVDFDVGTLRIYRTNTGIRGEFDDGRKFTYKTTDQNKWDAADECAKFIISNVNGEISERKAKQRLERLNFKESTQSSLSEELNKWNNLLNKMDMVKSHHYEIKGNNTIVEYTKVGIDSVWTFEKNGEDIDVVVDWPNRPEWQEMKPVNFEYTLGYYEDYENDVKEFLTSEGKFH